MWTVVHRPANRRPSLPVVPMGSTVVTPSIFLVFLLLLSNPSPSSSFSCPFSNYHTLFSLSHSLFSRVANLRESRGDYNGAGRARSIARKLENCWGIEFGKVMWNVGWDYARRDDKSSFEMFGDFSELNEILRGLTEFTNVSSERERVKWMNRNYDNLFRVSKSLFAKLRKGPLQEVIETLQKEILEGDMLKDCLELGSTDLKGLITVIKDISSKSTFSHFHSLLSLSHPLFSRIANLHESCGDYNGAARARSIARKLGAFAELNEILRGLGEFTSVSSKWERVMWMNRNYENLFRVSKSLFGKFRKVF